MTLVRMTYIVCDTVFVLALLAFAAAAPVWVTPGYYWWTALAIFMMFSQGYAFTKRLNSWGGMGEV